MTDILNAIWLGIVEGLTEFLPVSSTAHLLVTENLLGLNKDQWEAFTVVIQLGAVLSVVAVYWRKFWEIVSGLGGDPKARHFALAVIVAFLPSAVLGVLVIKIINNVLLDPVRAMPVIAGDADPGRHPDPDLRAHRAAAALSRRRQAAALQGVPDRPLPVPGAGARRVAFGRHDPGRRTAGRGPQGRRAFHLLSRGADDVRRHGVRALQEARRLRLTRASSIAIGFVVSFVVALFVVRDVHRLHRPLRPEAVRLVPHRGGLALIAVLALAR